MTESPIILVVDDEPLIRQSLDSLLRSVGYHVRTVSSALAARTITRAFR